MPATRARPKGSRQRLLIAAGVVLALVVLYLLVRGRGSLRAPNATGGTPGPDLTGSAAQQPAGGAASIPGNLPNGSIVESPNTVGNQVQGADGSSSDTPTMSTPITFNPGGGGSLAPGSGSSPGDSSGYFNSGPGTDYQNIGNPYQNPYSTDPGATNPGAGANPYDVSGGNVTGHGFV